MLALRVAGQLLSQEESNLPLASACLTLHRQTRRQPPGPLSMPVVNAPAVVNAAPAESVLGGDLDASAALGRSGLPPVDADRDTVTSAAATACQCQCIIVPLAVLHAVH